MKKVRGEELYDRRVAMKIANAKVAVNTELILMKNHRKNDDRNSRGIMINFGG